MATYRIELIFQYSTDEEDEDAALEEFKDEFPEWPGELTDDSIEKI